MRVLSAFAALSCLAIASAAHAGAAATSGKVAKATQLCTANLCSSYSTNQKRGSDPCGSGKYGASRDGGKRLHKGWDVKCNGNATVYAPFAGKIALAAPYAAGTKKCCNIGFKIDGSGAWAGYTAKIFYADPSRVKMGSTVTHGQAVATHRSLSCSDCFCAGMTDHIHVEIIHGTNHVDPEPYLFC